MKAGLWDVAETREGAGDGTQYVLRNRNSNGSLLTEMWVDPGKSFAATRCTIVANGFTVAEWQVKEFLKVKHSWLPRIVNKLTYWPNSLDALADYLFTIKEVKTGADVPSSIFALRWNKGSYVTDLIAGKTYIEGEQ